MKQIKENKTISEYTKKNPKKAGLIKNAVKRGVKEYAETFRRLATS